MAEHFHYALQIETQKVVHIKYAKNGLSCNCQCFACGERLEAIQGEIREWHFRHKTNVNCKGGQETAIHKLAKQIIAENSSIDVSNEILLYSNARQEEKLFEFVPDVTVSGKDFDVHFEVVVTNPVNTAKELFYKIGKHKSVEINLTSISYNVAPTELKEIVLRSAKRRKIFWEVNQEVIEKEKSIFEKLISPALIVFFAFALNKAFFKKKKYHKIR